VQCAKSPSIEVSKGAIHTGNIITQPWGTEPREGACHRRTVLVGVAAHALIAFVMWFDFGHH
jgi:hypothetical protein